MPPYRPMASNTIALEEIFSNWNEFKVEMNENFELKHLLQEKASIKISPFVTDCDVGKCIFNE